MSEQAAALEDLAGRRGLSGLQPVGSGLEFSVHRALGRDGRPVALRLAHRRFDSNANDPRVDTRALLVQEYEITRYLAAHRFPVAEPLELVLADEPTHPDVLLSRYVSDDGSDLDPVALGQLLARLHLLTPPHLPPVASEGVPAPVVIATRIRRRWSEVGRYVDGWPGAPSGAQLAGLLAGVEEGSLVHLDVRMDNIRRRRGSVAALLDWSNMLRGDAAVELGRLVEYARYPENGLEWEAIRAGYASVREAPPAGDPAMMVCRLDAALMLALVFLAEAPDPSRGPAAALHARELGDRVAFLARG